MGDADRRNGKRQKVRKRKNEERKREEGRGEEFLEAFFFVFPGVCTGGLGRSLSLLSFFLFLLVLFQQVAHSTFSESAYLSFTSLT